MGMRKPYAYSEWFNTFVDCPSVDFNTFDSAEDFWGLMRREPRPRKLISGEEKGSSATEEDVMRLLQEHTHWNASITMVTAIDHKLSLWRTLQHTTPLPAPAQPVDLYPMISLGQRGTGELRLARHRHGATAMRLLVGEKVWAFRAPGDPECRDASGSCSLPFDVCAHHHRSGATRLPCVQRAGETIVFPDGWHHGTCNTGDWTVGWGGQGLRVKLDARPCGSATPSTDGHRNQSRVRCEGLAFSHAVANVGVPMEATRTLSRMVQRGSVTLPLDLRDCEQPWSIAAYHAIQSAMRSFAFQIMPGASRRRKCSRTSATSPLGSTLPCVRSGACCVLPCVSSP